MAVSITIIGAGPGGYEAAFHAADLGAQVNLIEKAALGGTCLNQGCIPTKTLKSSAEALEYAHRAAEFAVKLDCEAAIDMPALRRRKDKVVSTLVGGLEKTCAKKGVNLVRGEGSLLRPGLVRVRQADGSVEEISSDKVILATGSKNMDLPGLVADHQHILNSDDALALDYLPQSLLIVGGGVVGCELACIFKAFGSQVTLLEAQDRLLPMPGVDKDLSKLLQREMKKQGVKTELQRTVTSWSVADGKVKAVLGPSPFYPEDSLPAAAKQPAELEVDKILVCAGRSPNTTGLGLAEAGVETDRRGFVLVNERLETNLPGVYAIGDLLGPAKIMLAHMASAEASVAVHNCLGGDSRADYAVVPSAIFTSPEIGCVGLSEDQAVEQGYKLFCPQFQVRELGKAQAMGAIAGIVKLVAEADSGKLLGAHICCASASDLVAEMTLALKQGLTLADIASTIHAHPTLAEGLYEAARQWALCEK